MSDAPKSDNKPNGDWVMPDPVFRSTPGHTPGSIHETLRADDVTTQPGFTDEDSIDTLAPDFVENKETPTDKPAKVTAAPPAEKKRGCARSFVTLLSLIALAVIGIVIALVYFIFYYKAADTGTF